MLVIRDKSGRRNWQESGACLQKHDSTCSVGRGWGEVRNSLNWWQNYLGNVLRLLWFFSWGCCGLSAGVFAGRGILCWHKELLILLFLTQWCKPQDKNITWFYKMIIVAIGTVSHPEWEQAKCSFWWILLWKPRSSQSFSRKISVYRSYPHPLLPTLWWHHGVGHLGMVNWMTLTQSHFRDGGSIPRHRLL